MILDQLIAYVDFGEEDAERLCRLHEALSSSFPKIADRFYDALLADADASLVISGPDQVLRLRMSLIEWMSSGLRGPLDEEFCKKRSRIGRRHVQIGLPQQYMFAAVNVIRTEYQAAIDTLYSRDEAAAVFRSVNKLLDMELALMLGDYQRASEELLIEHDRKARSERLAALQTMTTGLAHEVRNPLNSATLQLELVERRLRREKADTAFLEPIKLAVHEIERLSVMLDQFLEFASAAELTIQEQDAISIARHVIEMERAVAANEGVSIELASPASTAVAAFDASKLHQIIRNLLRNGIEAASPTGSVSIDVSVVDGVLFLRVSDNGPGIPAQVQPRMWEPFFSTKDGNAGMGLAIAHNFVTMHGGKLDVETSSIGTTVTVTIARRSIAK